MENVKKNKRYLKKKKRKMGKSGKMSKNKRNLKKKKGELEKNKKN